MKLLDVMKKYDRCVVRESAKLTKIYNLLLKESEEVDNIEEAEVCPDCGEDPCTCESDKEVDATEEVNEEDNNVMTAEEFFAEAEKAAAEETSKCDASEEATSEAEETEETIDESENEDEKKSEEVDESETENAEEEIDEEEEEKKLEESLKSYRRANHRLFNN